MGHFSLGSAKVGKTKMSYSMILKENVHLVCQPEGACSVGGLCVS
jgi:hypothetical protein